MSLKYRGNSYEQKSPSVETADSKITAKYRGASYPIKYPVNLAPSRSNAKLKFRGVVYSPGSTSEFPSPKIMGDGTNNNRAVAGKNLSELTPSSVFFVEK
ncbi:DUF4278 domain-containing protein [Capilliphycus salinus ALCB114379]|uniref:DUF4278 domain-containing protein n=1 Tax=Capilliphycus salinus TaxID=2768948 RepID=UPI0039A52209